MKHFIVKFHEANTKIGTLSAGNLLDFLNCSVTIVKNLQSFRGELSEVLGEVSIESLSDDELDSLLELLEDSVVLDTTPLDLFVMYNYSRWGSLNKYLRDTIYYIKTYNALLEKYVQRWTRPTQEDLVKMKSYCESVLSNLLFIIYFEFDMGSVFEEVSGRYYIDEIYNKFCNQFGLDPEENSKAIEDLKKVFKIHLAIFDEYPELEEPFSVIMGPNLVDIDEEKLTLDIVTKVISGELSDSQAHDATKLTGEESKGLEVMGVF